MLVRCAQWLRRLLGRPRRLHPGARLWDEEEGSEVEVISACSAGRCLVRYPDGWERVVKADKLKKAQ